MPARAEVTTVVLHRDGRHHATIKGASPEDARRWADEGFHVFQIAAASRLWAVLHVNTGRTMDSSEPAMGEPAAAVAEFLLIEKKGEG